MKGTKDFGCIAKGGAKKYLKHQEWGSEKNVRVFSTLEYFHVSG